MKAMTQHHADNSLASDIETIWNYHLMKHALHRADCILVLGSIDLRVAEWGADLYRRHLAPIVVVSGGVAHANDLLSTGWNTTEAQKFAEIAESHGVPHDRIIVEDKSTNTSENVRFSMSILKDRGIDVRTVILVQKPYMERRSYATFKKHCPSVEVAVSSPPLSFDTYCRTPEERELVAQLMVGDLQRIKVYGERGFQIPQDIPPEVWGAFERMVSRGYTKHLIPT
jgi:uncharacterized SAM-binding protein YcdF (DUF218 family)